jgi:hypothetical protein
MGISTKSLFVAGLFGLYFFFSSSLSNAEQPRWKDPTITLTAGTSLTDFNSELQANSKTHGFGREIDLEDDLGFDESAKFSRFSILWDLNPKHSIGFTYLPLHRDAKHTLNKDFQYEDVIFKADAYLKNKAFLDIYDLEYTYYLFSSEKHKFGIAAGIYWLSWEFSTESFGEITFLKDDSTVTFSDGFEKKEDLDAPLPVFGFNYQYNPSKHWRYRVGARMLNATVNDYDGRILLANIAVEYHFNQTWGAGLSINGFDINVKTDTKDFLGEFQWQYSGLNAHIIAKF